MIWSSKGIDCSADAEQYDVTAFLKLDRWQSQFGIRCWQSSSWSRCGGRFGHWAMSMYLPLRNISRYQNSGSSWSAQLKDATEAKQELETLIVRLTAEMQRIFTERFAGINQAFQEIFRELFDGGEASLELTDAEDVLHAGIEIRVAPPGKVIKNLIALSGGEQSFVAIAITLPSCGSVRHRFALWMKLMPHWMRAMSGDMCSIYSNFGIPHSLF